MRDATLALQALLLGGYREEAARFRQWVLRAVAGDPERLQIMYGVGGERRLTELDARLAARLRRRRARCASATPRTRSCSSTCTASSPTSCGRRVRAGFALDGDAWALQLLLLESLAQKWREPDQGIWEVRGPRRHFVHSKVLRWVAFDRAIAMVEHSTTTRSTAPSTRGVRSATRSTTQVCERGYNAELGAFVQSYDDDRLDASVLMIPLVGLPARRRSARVDVDDRRDRPVSSPSTAACSATTRTHERRRHRRAGRRVPRVQLLDGLRARRDRASATKPRRCSSGCSTLANDVGLFSEEYDPVSRRMLGNFPQAFTHLALVDAAQDLTRSRPDRAGGTAPDRDRRDAGSVRGIGRRRRPVVCPPWLS